MNTSNFCLISIIVVLFTGYLNFGYTTHIPSPETSKNWPTNVSVYPTSFVTLPGGVNFSFYDPILALVNKTRSIPNLVARHGDFKLLQAVLLKAIGAFFVGIGIIIVEAFELKKQGKPGIKDPPLSVSHGTLHASSYDTPPSSSYGAPPSNSYSAPAPPSSSYGAPPSSSYGAPPSSSYGAPPSSSYGAPPSSSYEAPPSSSYGAPPPPYMKPNR